MTTPTAPSPIPRGTVQIQGANYPVVEGVIRTPQAEAPQGSGVAFWIIVAIVGLGLLFRFVVG